MLKEGATFRFTRTIFRLKIVYGNLNRSIMEALYIKYTKPEINLQITGMGRTLRLLGDKDTCHTTNSHIQHPALAVTTPNSHALPNTQ